MPGSTVTGGVLPPDEWFGGLPGVVIAGGALFTDPDGRVLLVKPNYRDHWTIPVRTATGDVLWPRGKDGEPVPRPPEGVEHSYAPLAIVDVPAEGDATVEDAREFLVPLARTTVP